MTRTNKIHVRIKHKATVWQQRVSDAGYSVKEFAKQLGYSYRYTVAYLSGFVFPNPDAIRKICTFLNVDIEQGTQDFKDVFYNWGVEHADTHKRFSNTYVPKDTKAKAVVNSKAIPKEIKPVVETPEDTSKKHSKRKMGFWQHKISGKGMSIKELAEELGKPYPTVTAYLSGFVMPDKDIIIEFSQDS